MGLPLNSPAYSRDLRVVVVTVEAAQAGAGRGASGLPPPPDRYGSGRSSAARKWRSSCGSRCTPSLAACSAAVPLADPGAALTIALALVVLRPTVAAGALGREVTALLGGGVDRVPVGRAVLLRGRVAPLVCPLLGVAGRLPPGLGLGQTEQTEGAGKQGAQRTTATAGGGEGLGCGIEALGVPACSRESPVSASAPGRPRALRSCAGNASPPAYLVRSVRSIRKTGTRGPHRPDNPGQISLTAQTTLGTSR